MSNEPTAPLRSKLFIRMMLILTTGLLLIGLVSPMLTMSQFYFFESSFSVVGGVWSLFQDGQIVLALIVSIFSIVIPLIKLLLLFLTTRQGTIVEQNKILALMHDYGRWAMLDVMVVAVLIVTVKLGAVATIDIHWGLYVFATAVVMIMFLTHIICKRKHE